jgi:hypothetical protein
MSERRVKNVFPFEPISHYEVEAHYTDPSYWAALYSADGGTRRFATEREAENVAEAQSAILQRTTRVIEVRR